MLSYLIVEREDIAQVTVEGYRFEVMGMDGRRVDRVLIVPPKDEA